MHSTVAGHSGEGRELSSEKPSLQSPAEVAVNIVQPDESKANGIVFVVLLAYYAPVNFTSIEAPFMLERPKE
jgi:hypothetical protein